MPKANLEQNPDLEFEFLLAKELHMTHTRLIRELGVGELAYWHAVLQRENARISKARADAARGTGS